MQSLGSPGQVWLVTAVQRPGGASEEGCLPSTWRDLVCVLGREQGGRADARWSDPALWLVCAHTRGQHGEGSPGLDTGIADLCPHRKGNSEWVAGFASTCPGPLVACSGESPHPGFPGSVLLWERASCFQALHDGPCSSQPTEPRSAVRAQQHPAPGVARVS